MDRLGCGVILAGGLARRMGGRAKHGIQLHGKPLLDHVIERAAPQVEQLLLNINQKIDPPITVNGKSVPIIADSLEGYLGPLAGVLSAMEWAQKNSQSPWLASFAVDSPLFPTDLARTLLNRLTAAPKDSTIICPTYAGHRQPTFCLWRIDQAQQLRHWLTTEQNYRMGAWLQQQTTHFCDLTPADEPFADQPQSPLDPFTNINTPEDLELIERRLSL